MWIWIILIAAAIGGLIGFFGSENGEGAAGGAMAGGCLAAGCIVRIVIFVLGILFVFWIFGLLFG